MSDRYVQLQLSEAKKLSYSLPKYYLDWEDLGDDGVDEVGIWDSKTGACIGLDGDYDCPEDNYLYRNFSWVVEALNAAYKSGFEDGDWAGFERGDEYGYERGLDVGQESGYYSGYDAGYESGVNALG